MKQKKLVLRPWVIEAITDIILAVGIFLMVMVAFTH